MKPISDKAFGYILRKFSTSRFCSITCSEATCITLEEIGSICNPEIHDHDAFIFNQPNGNTEKDSFIEGIVIGVYKMVIESENKNDNDLREFLKDNTYERFDGSEPEIASSYTNFHSFYKEVDLEFVRRTVKRCWNRSITTEEPYSEDEIIDLAVADSIGLDDFS